MESNGSGGQSPILLMAIISGYVSAAVAALAVFFLGASPWFLAITFGMLIICSGAIRVGRRH